jgi:DNA polymerase-3 subunit alpha
MRILNRLGGIELAKAYACIKAISKKNHEIINARKADFINGAKDRGMPAEKADEIFELIVKFGGYGFNKCVASGTEVVDAVTGEVVTVGELFDTHRAVTVHALGADGKLRPRAVTDVMWNGRKRVYRLTTELGKQIVATTNHPFRTLDGWTNLGALKPGDRIAAPRRLAVPATESWPRHEVSRKVTPATRPRSTSTATTERWWTTSRTPSDSSLILCRKFALERGGGATKYAPTRGSTGGSKPVAPGPRRP